MSKTTKNILVEDFYQTELTNNLADSWDIILIVTQVPQHQKWFIIVDPDNILNREKMFYNKVVWNSIYVRWNDRIEPKSHLSTEKVQINDTSLVFNYLSKLNSTTFFIEQLWNVEIRVLWWPIAKWIETIEVMDQDLILSNWINYIYYKLNTNTIKSTTNENTATTEKGIITAEVTVVSSLISKIEYRHHWLFIWNFIESITKTWTTWIVDTYTITYTDGTTSIFTITNWNWISNIVKTWTAWLVDTYTITYQNGTTSTFTVTNWNWIANIVKINTTWLIDTYQINFTDWTNTTYTITNWSWIINIVKINTTWLIDTYQINFTDWTNTTYTITNWSWIVSTTKTWTVWLIDTYTITYQNGTTSTFTVTNWSWTISSIVWWSNITINNLDPANPIINLDWEKFTNIEKTKLWTIENNAKANVQSDFNEINNTLDTFIKNKLQFWTTAGTMLEWNYTPPSDNTKADKTNVLEKNNTTSFIPTTNYHPATKKYVDDNAWWGGWWIETVKIAWPQIAWTEFFEYIADWNKTVWNIKIALQVANTGANFIVKCYKNWISLNKDISIINGWWIAINGRHIANLNIATALVNTDVFTLKITQVWSAVAGSDFSCLINIS